MAELPLLFFPNHEVASRTKRKVFPGKLNLPSVKKQKKRLEPVFQKLQDSFGSRSVELQQTPAGIDLEQVLVIETVGNLEDFGNAVKKIDGLEWMGGLGLDGILPDDDFFNKKDRTIKLDGRLFMIMSNHEALKQLLSLWEKYAENPDTMDFTRGEYHGLAKFRDVFLHLKDIRRWGVEDRLENKEVLEEWTKSIEIEPYRNVFFEAELWFRGSDDKRKKSEDIVTELIRELGGRLISQCVIPSIAYHSVLGEISAKVAMQIRDQPEVDLFKCENIMFVKPTGQMAIGKEPVQDEISDYLDTVNEKPEGDPVVAVFDGLPLENHSLLAGRLIVDDPDNIASEYPAHDRQHGTAMTSLIVNGDLSEKISPLSRPVYVRPIMKPSNSNRGEEVPEKVLLVDYIHQAVKRIMEDEGEDQAVAPTIKIINFSIGDSARPFIQLMSPLARLLDWLSSKYNILFIISSGNHSQSINTGMSRNDFENLNSSDLETIVVQKIYEDSRNRKLLSPAESINGLTVGALHHDSSHGRPIGDLVDVFESTLPSPISAFGAGYRRAIKPDLLFSGGRVLFSKSPGSSNISLRFNNMNKDPGNQVATPSDQVGDLSKIKFCRGSSNSAALTSRAAGICYDYLTSLFFQQSQDDDFKTYGVPILKAMIVHGCSWDKIGNKLEEILKTGGYNNQQVRKRISQWAGYGVPDIEKALGCNDQRATLIGFGELKDGDAHVFNLPLPPSLSTKHVWRKLTVTLAWNSPVASNTQRYRGANLWFDFEDGIKSRDKLKSKLRVKGIDSDHYATRRGTIQHEIFEGKTAIAISNGDNLKIKVNCRKDARKIGAPVAYGLVVSLEVAEGINLPIYNEIRTRIAPPVKIRT